VKITSGSHAGETFIISKESFSIGRGAENDIILINDPKLSRQHIKVSLKDALLFIENLSTRNPIVYNDKLENNIEIKSNDRIKIGDTEIEFTWNASSLEKTLMAENLTQLTATSTSTAMTKVDPVDFKSLNSFSLVEKNNVAPLAKSKPTNTLETSSNKNPVRNYSGVPSSLSPSVSPSPSPSLNNVKIENKISKHVHSKQNNPSVKIYQTTPISNTFSSYRLPIIAGGLILLILLILTLGGEKKQKKTTILRDTNQLNAELLKSTQQIEDYVKEKKLMEDGRMERVYESAQSYYIKGFRDYRQGQFSRAILSFQAALSFDPNHVLAKKYLLQSVKKHSEVVQFNLDQAKRYKEKSNYRLCRSAAKQVIVMALRKDQSDPQYKDGKKIFDECDILSKGRF